jgi:hypothetical protein
MNWLHFLLWVAGIYLFYYLIVILIDIAAGGRSPAAIAAGHELTFSEQVESTRMEHNVDSAAKASIPGVRDTGIKISADPEIMASGGVPIKDIFSLARKEAIIFTRSVSY